MSLVEKANFLSWLEKIRVNAKEVDVRACLESFQTQIMCYNGEKPMRKVSKMHDYPSDISREQFELIREDLENAKRKTRPRTYDLYDIFCAVLYVLHGGIQWRMLPANYPSWELVYYYYSIWSKADEQGVSLLDRLLKKISQNGAQ